MAATAATFVALLHSAPPDPPPASPWRALTQIGLLFGVLPDLPEAWAVDFAHIPSADAAPTFGAPVPLGKLGPPLRQVDAAKAWQAWQEGRFGDALEPAQKAWRSLAKDDPERPLLAFLVTQTRLYANDTAGAIAAAKVATAHPLLGGQALAFLASKADEQGLALVVLALLQNRGDPHSLLLRARALRRSGQLESAAELLTHVGAMPGTALWRRQQLEAMRLAHAQQKLDAAVALARQLIDQGGKSAQTEEAVDYLIGGSDAVWQARLHKRPEDAPAVLDALVWTAQRRRYPRATPALEALAKDPALPLAIRCHARSWAAHTHDRKGELDAAIAQLEVVASECTAPEVRALAVQEDALASGEALWRLGRAMLLQGNLAGTARLHEALDAGLTGLDAADAGTLLMLAELPDAAQRLRKHGATSANDYAERDVVDVIGWRFAMDAMTAGKWQDALRLLDRLVEVRDAESTATAFLPRPKDAPPPGYDDRDWARGRADYFAARALQALGKDDAAIARWQRVVVRHPLSYYAAMSLGQLQASGARMPELPAQLAVTGPALPETVLADPQVQRARLLGQLGWHEAAGDLLDAVGLGRDVAPADKWAAGDPAGAWARAALDDEAQRWTSSHATGRDALRRYATQYPGEKNREAWKIAYPRAFPALVEAAAAEFGLHPSIIWAIGRSESGFNPRVESHAAAIGLLQLILPTAQAMAKPLGLTADATTLRQPAVNVRLGARYLKLLLARFDREAQMAAGYNAGGGAVGRWRKTRGDWPLDLFVEAIPFRETRDYAKRVLSSIAAYRNLYAGETLHAFGLSQKPVPTQDEPPTEPATGAATQAARVPLAAVQVSVAESAPVAAHVAPASAQPARPSLHRHAGGGKPGGVGMRASERHRSRAARSKPESPRSLLHRSASRERVLVSAVVRSAARAHRPGSAPSHPHATHRSRDNTSKSHKSNKHRR